MNLSQGIPIVWRSHVVGWVPPVAVRDTGWIRFVVMPELSLVASGLKEESLRFETIDMRVVNRSSSGVPGELHVESLRNLKKLPEFTPEDCWLKLLAEADE